MALIDLYRLCGGQPVGALQTDLIGVDASHLVVTMRKAEHYTAFPSLTPAMEVEGAAWIMHVQELAAVPDAELAGHRNALKRALDILIDDV